MPRQGGKLHGGGVPRERPAAQRPQQPYALACGTHTRRGILPIAPTTTFSSVTTKSEVNRFGGPDSCNVQLWARDEEQALALAKELFEAGDA